MELKDISTLRSQMTKAQIEASDSDIQKHYIDKYAVLGDIQCAYGESSGEEYLNEVSLDNL